MNPARPVLLAATVLVALPLLPLVAQVSSTSSPQLKKQNSAVSCCCGTLQLPCRIALQTDRTLQVDSSLLMVKCALCTAPLFSCEVGPTFHGVYLRAVTMPGHGYAVVDGTAIGEVCPLGTYNPGDNKLSCRMCSNGLTTADTGATGVNQCGELWLQE
jgi:hypothetical protein